MPTWQVVLAVITVLALWALVLAPGLVLWALQALGHAMTRPKRRA